ncbi:hypothetical protein OKW29_002053 [Paraburkholderia sp. CI3]
MNAGEPLSPPNPSAVLGIGSEKTVIGPIPLPKIKLRAP